MGDLLQIFTGIKERPIPQFHTWLQLAQFITAMFKALTAIMFAAAITMVIEAKWYLVETEARRIFQYLW